MPISRAANISGVSGGIEGRVHSSHFAFVMSSVWTKSDTTFQSCRLHRPTRLYRFHIVSEAIKSILPIWTKSHTHSRLYFEEYVRFLSENYVLKFRILSLKVQYLVISSRGVRRPRCSLESRCSQSFSHFSTFYMVMKIICTPSPQYDFNISIWVRFSCTIVSKL